MLDLREYTRQELIELFHTERLDSIKAKLKRQGYSYTTNGRGKTFTLTITEQPLRFRNFCMEQLHFAPQTDFKRLKRFLYQFMFDEEFRQLPNVGMKEAIPHDTYVSEQTISRWITQLYKENIIGYGDYIYYAIVRNNEEYCREITKEEYTEAWRIYWEYNEFGYTLALNTMCHSIGGYPYKKEKIIFNAFESERIKQLEKILREEINVDE